MQPPEIVRPEKLADYLEVLTKAVFESGMSWKVVENKWPGFREAFHGFDPERIASLTPDEIDTLTSDARIIRNRRKIEATIHNARALLAAEREFGSFGTYLQSQGGFEAISADLRKRCKNVGAFGAYYFLYVVGEPAPPHEEFRAKLAQAKG